VTVSNRNYARFLDRNVQSILAQTFEDFELIMIDNASTDGSLELMERYASTDSRIRVIAHDVDLGMFASLRESCDVARGRYRVHVDADDWVIDSKAFEIQIEMLEQHPAMAFVYCSMTMTDTDGNVVNVSHPHDGDVVLPGESALEGVLSFNLTHTGMMLRLDSYRSTLGYPNEYAHVADMLLAVRLCEVGDVGYLDHEFYAFHQHATNLHTRPQLEVLRREVVPVIDLALDGPLGANLPDREALRRRVMRRATVQLPTHYIFMGQRRIGWRLYWEAVKVDPIASIVQFRTISLVARTLLGARCYGWLRRRLGRGPQTPVTSSFAR
jgi:glycosyltransferase involved in cell wall biosynthesis